MPSLPSKMTFFFKTTKTLLRNIQKHIYISTDTFALASKILKRGFVIDREPCDQLQLAKSLNFHQILTPFVKTQKCYIPKIQK